MNTLIVLLGPTGVGKTELSLKIAEHLNTPIINADSRQLFAEIPIAVSYTHLTLPTTPYV